MNVGDILASLGLDSSSFMSELGKASREAKRAGRQIQSSLSLNSTGADDLSGQINNANKANKTFRFGLKDTQRVLSGILMARAFNSVLREIREATGALITFQSHLEQTEISFKYLLNSAEAASALTTKLQNIAAYTPFTVESAANTTKQLLAMGVSAREVESVLLTMSDTVSALGGSEVTFERVGYAMGQIKASSKLLSQDVRQLINAGIPAWQILREELGMTQDQLNKTVRSGLNSNTAYYALINGMQKRYAGASAEQAKTWDGLLSTLGDLSLQAGTLFTVDLFDGFKAGLQSVTDMLQEIIAVGQKSGAGGILNHLFPDGGADRLRLFIASLRELWIGLKDVLSTLWPVVSAIGQGFLIALTTVLGPLGKVLQTLKILKPILEKLAPLITVVTAAWATWAILGKVITLVTFLGKAIAGLKVLTMIPTMISGVIAGFAALAAVVGPVAAAVIMLVGALGLLAGGANLVQKLMDTVSKKMSNLLGLDYSGILPEQEMADYEDQWNKYLEGLEDGANGVGDIEDGLEDADKAAKKFLASFDEVFQVPEEDAASALDKFTEAFNPDAMTNWNPFKDLAVGGDDTDWSEDPAKKWDIPLIVIPIKWDVPPFPEPPSPLHIPVNYTTGLVDLPAFDTITIPVDYLTRVPLDIPEVQPIEIPVEWNVPEFPMIKAPEFPAIPVEFDIEQFPAIEMPKLPDIAIGWDIKVPEMPTIDWSKYFPKAPKVEIGVEVEDDVSTKVAEDVNRVTKRVGEMVEPVSVSPASVNELNVAILKTMEASQLTKEQLAEMQTYWLTNEHNISQYFTEMGSRLKEYKRLLTESGSLKPENFFQKHDLEFIPAAIDGIKTSWTDLDNTVRSFNATRNDTMGIFKDWRESPIKQVVNETAIALTDVIGGFALISSGGATAAAQAGVLSGELSISSSVMDDLALAASKHAAPAMETLTGKVIAFAPQAAKGATAAGVLGTAMNLAAQDIDSSASVMDTTNTTHLQNMTRIWTETALGIGTQSATSQKHFEALAAAAGIQLPKIETQSTNMKTTFSTNAAGINTDLTTLGNGLSNFALGFGTTKDSVVIGSTAMKNGVNPNFGSMKQEADKVKTSMQNMGKETTKAMDDADKAVRNKSGGINSFFSKLKETIDGLVKKIKDMFDLGKLFGGGTSGDSGTGAKGRSVDTATFSMPTIAVPGYRTGGIVDRDQIIRVGEGNRKEAVIPLEQGMAPFAEAIAERINTAASSTTNTGTGDRPIMYVGTLIADDRSLRELNRKMEVIQAEENARKMR